MAPHRNQGGFALVLTLIFAILLYVLVAEIVVSARLVRLTGENDALLGRMRSQMDYTLTQVEDTLLQDLLAQSAGAEGGGTGGAGALGAALGGAGAGAGAGEEGAEEADPAATCDCSRDQWFAPQAYSDGDLTTYYFVEDENRKLNILALWSPDEEFARFSRDRLVRLIDNLREDTEFDVGLSDAERLVTDLEEWARRTGTDSIPRPKLKSDSERRREFTLPMHLDELLLLPSVTEDLFFDKVYDGKVILGLEAVLTVWTSLGLDPGDPERNARQQAQNQAAGQETAPAPGTGTTDPNDPNAPPPQPEGEGIRINVNTAPRPVLRALFPQDKIPDLVIDAIIRHRNEVDDTEEPTEPDTSEFGNLNLGSGAKKKFFAEVSDLDELPEFANIADPQLKADFQTAVTTRSDVFSIHLATMFRRNEENRVFVLRRARTIVVRRDDGSDGYLYPLVLQEERRGIRVMPVDEQETFVDLGYTYSEMDFFAQEERAWNPFLLDFYLPKYQRQQFFNQRSR